MQIEVQIAQDFSLITYCGGDATMPKHSQTSDQNATCDEEEEINTNNDKKME